MRRLSLQLLGIIAIAAAFALGGCGESEDSSTIKNDTIADTAGDFTNPWGETTEPIGCKNDGDCGDMAVGPCETAVCDLDTGLCAAEPVEEDTACDDANQCTENDRCIQGACVGDSINCNDDNPCTIDGCSADSGCTHDNKEGSCDDNNFCTTEDHCEEGTCVGTDNPACDCEADADCAAFEDGNKCNGTLVCVNKACVIDEDTIVTCDTTGVGQCQNMACDTTDGVCKTSPKTDGTTCTDGDACTTGDVCTAGQCGGNAKNCDDDNECTDDSCDAATGCVFEPNTADCNDGDPCTENDVCADGVCAGTDIPDCGGCTTDEDCAALDDGNLCNGTYECQGGDCMLTAAVVCDPSLGGACKDVVCDPLDGLCKAEDMLDGEACNDTNACTTLDHCVDGVCVGTAVVCNDTNPCTDDSCDPESGCLNTFNSDGCDDGNPCTTGDVCADGVCAGTDDGSCECASDDDCTDDGNKCNGTLICQDNQCVVDPDSVVVCDTTGLPACVEVVCMPESGLCKTKNLEDGTVCDDGNACTDDSCEPSVGCVYDYNSDPCDDGTDCTTNDKCVDGACAGTPTGLCECDTAADCTDDGNVCNGTPICVENQCVIDPATVVECDQPASVCKVAYCDPASGNCITSNYPNGKPCDDDDACTVASICQAGTCVGAGEVTCDDGNLCTDDSCDPAAGCIFAYNDADCDDGNGCTGGDYCLEGVCQPGTENLCADGCFPAWSLGCGEEDQWGTDEGISWTNVIDTYSCTTAQFLGNEYTYLYTAPYDGLVTVSLSYEEALTAIIVLEDFGEGCYPTNCRTWGFDQVSFEATEGATYFLVVDTQMGEGSTDVGGDYLIKVNCVPFHELSCDDGLDEDQDGLVDCDDEEDCLGTEACPEAICAPSWTLWCDSSDTWSNYGSGSTDLVEEYPCADPWKYPGPEYTYTFTAPADMDVTITLTDVSTNDVDILVLEDVDGSCRPENCIANGISSATFSAVAGQVYYVVVDGYNGAEGTYTITVDCPETYEIDCTDGLDDDDDGLTDCDDDDCDLDPACQPVQCQPHWEMFCEWGESYFNYGYGSTDLVDTYGGTCSTFTYDGPEYTYYFTAPYDGTITVTVDEDAGGNVLDIIVMQDADGTCNPELCVTTGMDEVTFDITEGATYYISVDGYNDGEDGYTLSTTCSSATELDCTDGVDDDDDGMIDCQDDDCLGTADCPECMGQEQIYCGDEIFGANDAQGFTMAIGSYPGCNSYDYSEGAEYAYVFTPDEAAHVVIEQLEDAEPSDIDILVLVDEGGCNPSHCLTFGLDSVEFDAEAGVTYYVVMDGWLGAADSYLFTVTCE